MGVSFASATHTVHQRVEHTFRWLHFDAECREIPENGLSALDEDAAQAPNVSGVDGVPCGGQRVDGVLVEGGGPGQATRIAAGSTRPLSSRHRRRNSVAAGRRSHVGPLAGVVFLVKGALQS